MHCRPRMCRPRSPASCRASAACSRPWRCRRASMRPARRPFGRRWPRPSSPVFAGSWAGAPRSRWPARRSPRYSCARTVTRSDGWPPRYVSFCVASASRRLGTTLPGRRLGLGLALLLAQLLQLRVLEPSPRLLLFQHFLVSLLFQLLGARRLVDGQRHEGGRWRLATRALELDIQAQLVGRIGVAQRLVEADQPLVIQLEQRPVEG